MAALVASACWLAPAVGASKVLHVDARAPEGGDGSAAKPLRSIKAALDRDKSGVEIRVATGAYPGSLVLDWDGGVGREIRIVGGFPGAQASAYAAGTPGSFDAPTAGARSTVKGTEAGRSALLVKLKEGDTSSRVELVGLELTGGTGTKSGDTWRGGGLYMDGGQLVLRGCLIAQNVAYVEGLDADARSGSQGGGLFANGKVEIVDTIIRGNRAGRGGGLATNGQLSMRDSRVEDNHGDGDHGGGLYATGDVELVGNEFTKNEIGVTAGYGWGGGVIVYGKGSRARLSWNRYTDNYAVTKGSGVFIDDEATGELTHELIVGNRCTKDGGAAVYVDGLEEGKGSTVVIDRSTIARHECGKTSGGGNAVLAESDAVVTVKRSVVWDNGADDFAIAKGGAISVQDSIARETEGGQGVVAVDPGFAGADDFHLKGRCRWDAATRAWLDDGGANDVLAGGEPGRYGDSPEATGAAPCPGKGPPAARYAAPAAAPVGAPVKTGGGSGCSVTTRGAGEPSAGVGSPVLLIFATGVLVSRRRAACALTLLARRASMVVLVVAGLLAPSVAVARVLHVDDDQQGKGDGSPVRPFGSLTQALAAAKDGDTIKVAVGTYRGNLKLDLDNGKGRARKIAGGYVGGTTKGYAAGKAGDFGEPSPGATSVIEGVKKGGPVVKVVLGDDGRVELSGLTLRGGTGFDVYGWRGGGLYARGGEVILRDSIVEKNTAFPSGTKEDGRGKSLGGGVFIASRGTIERVIVRKNRGGRGGGIASDGELTVRDSLICDNVGESDHGGGLYLTGPSVVTGNVIERNSIGKELGYGWGGGLIVAGDTTAKLSHNRVTRNSAPTKGSGVFIDDDAVAELSHEVYWDNVCGKDGGHGLYVDGLEKGTRVTMDRSTIAGHDCPRGSVGGNGIYVEKNSTLAITRSIIWGNGEDDFSVDKTSRITLSESVSEESWKGAKNSGKNPKFVDARRGDFHLRSKGCRWDAAARRWRFDRETSPHVRKDGGEPGAYGDTTEASVVDRDRCSGREKPPAPGWLGLVSPRGL